MHCLWFLKYLAPLYSWIWKECEIEYQGSEFEVVGVLSPPVAIECDAHAISFFVQICIYNICFD